MGYLGDLTVRANVETAGLERGLSRLRQGLLSVDEASRLPGMALLNSRLDALQRRADLTTAAFNRFNSGLRSVGTALTIGVTAPIVGLGVSMASAAADMDSLKRALTSVAGSSEGARQQLERLTEAAKAPGLGFKEAIQGSVRLQAVGIQARLAERLLSGLGNAIALTGGGKVELERVSVQLTQLAAKGKVLQQDLRPILESGPAIGQALQKAFGTIDSETIQELGLTSEQFLTRLAAGLEQLPKVTGGARNSFDNFTDALFRARAAIGEKLLPAIVPLAEGLANLLTKVEAINPETVRWGIAIAGVAAVAGPLILVISSVSTAVTALAAALSVGLLPVIAIGGPILIALAALSAMWVKNKLDALAAAAAADAYRASLLGLTEGQLIAERTEQRLRLSELRANEAAMIAARRASAPLAGTGRPMGAAAPFPGTGAILRPPTPEFRSIVNGANEAAFKVASLTRAIDDLHAASNRVRAPIAPPGGDGKRDPLAGTLDTLTDRMREFQQLQKFQGALAVNLLPDDAADQIRLVNSLAAELDTLTDGMNRFKAAGRTPPAGLTFGIDALNQQLAEAERRLEDLARLFNDTRLLGNVNVVLPKVEVAPGGVEVRGGTPFRAKGEAPDAPQSFMDKFTAGLAQATAQFSPLNLALSAINAVLAPLQPLLDALLVPFTIMGEILASLIVPVLRVLFYPLKLLGIVVSYIGEVIARVAGAIANAIGSLVRGIGRLVNKLPGSPGDPLVKAGQAMIDLGKQFRDAAKDMEQRRKELEKLSFDDALDGVNNGLDKLTEALTNVPPLFNLALRRLQAAGGGVPSVPAPGGLAPPPFTPPTTTEPRPPIGPTINLNFHENAIRGGGNATEVAKEVIRLAAGALERVSDSAAREVGLTLRMAVS